MEMTIPEWLKTDNNPPSLKEYPENPKPVHIYGLYDPITGNLRYIGKSIRPEQRLQNHMNEISHCHRSHWLQSLKARGLKPDMEILETVSGCWPWQESERFWIRRMKELGCDLVNNTSGGDGVPGLSGEGKERMLATWKGRKHTPETIAKLVAARALRPPFSIETRAKMSRSQTGRKFTAPWLDKIAIANRKVNEFDLEMIKFRLAGGERVRELAEEYGVHRTTISKIKMGRYLIRNRARWE